METEECLPSIEFMSSNIKSICNLIDIKTEEVYTINIYIMLIASEFFKLNALKRIEAGIEEKKLKITLFDLENRDKIIHLAKFEIKNLLEKKKESRIIFVNKEAVLKILEDEISTARFDLKDEELIKKILLYHCASTTYYPPSDQAIAHIKYSILYTSDDDIYCYNIYTDDTNYHSSIRFNMFRDTWEDMFYEDDPQSLIMFLRHERDAILLKYENLRRSVENALAKEGN